MGGGGRRKGHPPRRCAFCSPLFRSTRRGALTKLRLQHPQAVDAVEMRRAVRSCNVSTCMLLLAVHSATTLLTSLHLRSSPRGRVIASLTTESRRSRGKSGMLKFHSFRRNSSQLQLRTLRCIGRRRTRSAFLLRWSRKRTSFHRSAHIPIEEDRTGHTPLCRSVRRSSHVALAPTRCTHRRNMCCTHSTRTEKSSLRTQP